MDKIIVTVTPQEACKLLNGDLTELIRKTKPRKLPCEVFVCVKPDKNNTLERNTDEPYDFFVIKGREHLVFKICPEHCGYNGKIVARFTLNKVEEVCCEQLSNGVGYDTFYYTETIETNDELEKASCLDLNDLKQYLGVKSDGRIVGYAWHIDKLGIFDNTMELWQFKTLKNAERFKRDLQQAREDDYEVGTRIAEGIANDDECANCVELTEWSEGYYGLTHAPSVFCYVEV